MITRLATFKDIPNLIGLLETANGEFGNDSVPFDMQTTRNTLQRVINQREHAAFILEGTDGVIQGILVGLVNQLWFSRKRQAVDLIYYVREDSRGHGAKLLAAYLAWARCVPGVVEIVVGITSGTSEIGRVEGLLKASGLKKVGGTYMLHPAEEIEHEQSA